MKNKISWLINIALYISVMFFGIIYLKPFYLDSLLECVSNKKYLGDSLYENNVYLYLLYLVFSIASFFWTKRTLVFNNKSIFSYWIGSWVIDFAIPFISILIMLLYHNYYYVGDSVNISSIENPFLMCSLLAFKHVLFQILNGNIFFGVRKR